MLGFVPLTFGFSVTFLAPVFNQEALAGNASTLSLLLSATGIGALAGSLILARLGNIEEKGKLMFRTGYLWAVSICLFSTAQRGRADSDITNRAFRGNHRFVEHGTDTASSP